jgi:hypothetical protein
MKLVTARRQQSVFPFSQRGYIPGVGENRISSSIKAAGGVVDMTMSKDDFINIKASDTFLLHIFNQ